jgi:lauroyl/myristoyl acyltransferase
MTDPSHKDRWAYRHLYSQSVFALTSALIPFAGRPLARVISRAVAGFYASTQPSVVATVHDNLRLLDPSLPVSCARRVFLQFATCLADYVALSKMSTPQAVELCGEFVGREHLLKAAESGGAILATGHFGFFEYGTVLLGDLGLPVTAATLAEPTRSLTSWRASWRARFGAETLEVGEDPFSSLVIQKALAGGRFVALLADRPMAGPGVTISLPGGETRFSTSPAILSLLTGAPIIPVATSLRPDGKYRVVALPPERTRRAPHSERNQELERCSRAVASSLFSEIQKSPEQWFQFVPVRTGTIPAEKSQQIT